MATRRLLAILALLLLVPAPPAQAQELDALGQSIDLTLGLDPRASVELALPALDQRLHAQLSRGTMSGAASPWLDPLLWPDEEEGAEPPAKRTYDEVEEARCQIAGPLELRLTFLPVACPLDALHAGDALPLLPRETPAAAPEGEVVETADAAITPRGFTFPSGDAAAAVAVAGLAAAAAVGAAAAAASPTSAPLWDRARRLAWLLGAPLYTRLKRDSLLDHGARDALFACLKEQPGIAISDLSRSTGTPRNTVTHHLHMMERQGLVTSLRKGRVRLYFPAGSAVQKRKADALAALRHETTNALARAIGERPGLDQATLCERFGLAPSLAHWHVSRLVKSELVLQVRDGRHVRYYPGDAFHLVKDESAGAPGA